jgi:hypothetical protein
MAFSDIIKRPELVADYKDLSVNIGGLLLEFFRFRIGYAIFFIMKMDGFGEFIVLDFDFQDGDSAYVAHNPVAALPPPVPP